jgi:flagellar basal body-associated protein FliL
MISNNTELDQVSFGSESKNVDGPDNGFELDKLEIPKLPPKGKTEPVPDITQEKEFQATAESEAQPETGPTEDLSRVSNPKTLKKYLYLVIISGGLIILLGIIGLMATKAMQPKLTSADRVETDLGIYHPIEPIITNLVDNRYVHIILMLRSNSKETTRFMALESKVIDTVFGFLGSTNFQRQIAHGGSAKVKSVLYNELTELFEEKYPNQVVLSDVRLD